MPGGYGRHPNQRRPRVKGAGRIDLLKTKEDVQALIEKNQATVQRLNRVWPKGVKEKRNLAAAKQALARWEAELKKY